MHEQEEQQEYISALNILKSDEEPRKESYRAFLLTLNPEKTTTHHKPIREQQSLVWFRRSFVFPFGVGACILLLLIMYQGNPRKQALAEVITGTDADTEASSIAADVIDFGDLVLLDNDTSELYEL